MTPLEHVERLLDTLLAQEPWARLLGLHGVYPGTPLDLPLAVNREVQGFEDFSLARAPLIHPGDPAGSLLYHCLASPRVRPQGLAPDDYPTLLQIDQVENAIYSLITVPEQDGQSLVPAVFAYEYREAARTPHRRHADLVFSRIGIGRVGNAQMRYDPMLRSFEHGTEEPHEVRVQPVRYGLFLCERVAGEAMAGRYLGASQFGDAGREFLLPLIKLFPGQVVADQVFTDVELTSFHLTDRLRRLFTLGGLTGVAGQQLDTPPYLRTTQNGGLSIDAQPIGASLLVSSAAQPLVRRYDLAGGTDVIEVPPKGLGIDDFYDNRRYSTLRVGQRLFSFGIDYVASAITGAALGTQAFMAPRNCPEFVNMRHRQGSPGMPDEDLNLSLIDPEQFEHVLDKGGYKSVLYIDDICDGFVGARLHDSRGHRHSVACAFSVITAPDFFPCISGLDIRGFTEHFKDGGPSPLCEGRLRVNVRLRDPQTDAPVFNEDDTLAAAVSHAGRRDDDKLWHGDAQFAVSTFLTDGASNVFAPGWDVTYGRDSLLTAPYYHTAGLGAPFVEDAKLCAAANGMWAAASPDSARTFNPSRTPTAIPLTDQELGLHADSQAGQADGARRGWDGEFGPFFVMQGQDLAVNFADILRADYVTNALAQRMRFDLLRQLTRMQMRTRMKAFAAALALLEGPAREVKGSECWLVGFQEVGNWHGFSLDRLLPSAARATHAALVMGVQAWGADTGCVFVFSRRALESTPLPGTGRRLALCKSRPQIVAWRASDGQMIQS